jgi:DNA-binding CsgD family transcriptional regulator
MHVARYRDTPKTRRNLAIVRARQQGLSIAEVARMFGVSESRVSQICSQATRMERFAREHAESGGRARVRTLGGGPEILRLSWSPKRPALPAPA